MAVIGTFRLEHLVYRLWVADNFSVGLELIDGYSTRKGSLFDLLYDPADAFDTVYSTMDDVDLADSAWPVLNRAKEMLVGWVNAHKPGYLVMATSSPRKRRVYRRMARRVMARLPEYELQEIDGQLYFFRQARFRACAQQATKVA